ncbi:MAG: DUF924 family protein [Arenicella sp.]
MYQEIVTFWFDEIDSSKWWVKDEEFDNLLRQRFSMVHAQADQCELYEWRQTAKGRLAEVIVLDQFSRNMFRGSWRSFASDSLALALAQEAIALGVDQELTQIQRSFLYMPFMHSESARIHEIAVELFSSNGEKNNLNFELKHKAIIDRFGRYPHRNDILGRESSSEELEFLSGPGSSF